MAAPEDLDATVRAAQSGDEEAFRRLYRAQQPVLLRYLRVLIGEDAEDIASEAWLQIARDLGGFAGDWDGFRGWTATVARHRAMDSLRARRRRPQFSASVEHLLDLVAPEQTDDQALELVATDAAVALIASLPRDQAEAVMLRAVVGLDAETAGRILGKRAGAVRTAAYRGLRQLAQRLESAGSIGSTGPPARGAELPAARQQVPRTGVTTSPAPALKEVR
jgi:RNA polymerase sigma-70 factor (ECF subfamily)